MTQIYDKVALIGLGLIASSIYWAAKKHGLAHEISGYARSDQTRATARDIGLCDTVCDTLEAAVADADLIILCVPVGAMGEIAKAVAPCLKPGAVVTDVGSTKADVIDAVMPFLPKTVTFIPGHPVAGTEYSGPKSGFASLFENRWCLFTPLEGTCSDKLAQLEKFWQGMGAKTSAMDAAHHDLVLAVTSHVPHLIAYTMVGVADDLERVTDSDIIQFSAAGFRDFTRIAASDPTMWRDVFLSNRTATLEILGRFAEELFALQRTIRIEDGAYLHDYFTRTRAVRRGILDAGQDTDLPNFGRLPIERE